MGRIVLIPPLSSNFILNDANILQLSLIPTYFLLIHNNDVENRGKL